MARILSRRASGRKVPRVSRPGSMPRRRSETHERKMLAALDRGDVGRMVKSKGRGISPAAPGRHRPDRGRRGICAVSGDVQNGYANPKSPSTPRRLIATSPRITGCVTIPSAADTATAGSRRDRPNYRPCSCAPPKKYLTSSSTLNPYRFDTGATSSSSFHNRETSSLL